MRALIGGLVALLAACSPAVPDDSKVAAQRGPARDAGPSLDELCVSSDCGEATRLVAIPDAENILFGPDGRLFVSGGKNVYEVTRDAAGAYAATALSAVDCGFTGMAITRKHLYASCGDGRLFAGKYEKQIALAEIFQMTGMCIANGTAVGPDGRLYVVDEPLNCADPDPKVVALTLDERDATHVVAQQTWIQGSPTGLLWVDQDTVLRFPNGLVADGDTLYGTDGGSVYSVGVGADGAAGQVTPLFFEPTAHDDIGLAGPEGLVVTDFFKGRIFLLTRAGELVQETLPGTFTEPSSARLGRPPLFAPTDVLVTDKGVITEQNLPLDYLVLFRRKP
jgi:hypothetical protein